MRDLSRLLVGLGIVANALEARELAQGGAGEVRPHGQQLQRGDQGVAAEERVVAPGIARLDGGRARVWPAGGGEELVDLGDLGRDGPVAH